ncbi:Glu/Leu/Phe/Val dehydrogenase [Virgisporangium aliadipatigenens]|nr:Glu/Leu/Phe/Val dehydrogenase [Virgisporangium aliadipatigenens]
MEHEQVRIHTGRRSGLPVIIAVHSTTLGQAIGGCRLKAFPHWKDALDDALRLSAAMTDKAALAGLPHGGGKTVIASDGPLSGERRRAALLDVGDAVEGLGGVYGTGPDSGTSPADMNVIAERTRHVFCRPPENGGSGDSSPATAVGALAAIRAVAADLGRELDGLRCTLLGAGAVGTPLARLLTEAGATLSITDVDDRKKALADELGAGWLTPEEAPWAETDVLVPAALGGLLGPDTVGRLRCAAVAGPANNQLTDASVADLLHERGILFAPDVIVSAGGILHGFGVEIHHETPAQIDARLAGIGDTLATVLARARHAGTTPLRVAADLARERRLAPVPAG